MCTMTTAPARPNHRPAGGRPFNQSTNLGKIIDHRGYTVIEVASGSGVYPRTMSDYLADRKPISLEHRAKLAAFLKVDPDWF